jgi:hypothetical protein
VNATGAECRFVIDTQSAGVSKSVARQGSIQTGDPSGVMTPAVRSAAPVVSATSVAIATVAEMRAMPAPCVSMRHDKTIRTMNSLSR